MLNNLLRELALLWKNRRWLPTLFGQPSQDVTAYKSEMNPANLHSLDAVMKAAMAALVPAYDAQRKTFTLRPYLVGDYPYEADTEWYFVNGISTTPEIAVLNAEYLAEIFQRPIGILYNPTNGMLADLVECAIDRTFNHRTAITDAIANRILSRLFLGKRVRLIGHSQGGIIVAAVASRIARIAAYARYLDFLEVFTFAGACDELPRAEDGVALPFNEHFANWRDYVAQIGVIDCAKNISGQVYTHDADGHLLNAHYLGHFREGKYCNGRSRLYGYLRKHTTEPAKAGFFSPDMRSAHDDHPDAPR